MMVITGKKQKISKQKTGNDYRLTKKEAACIAPGLLLLICGIVLILMHIFVFGGGSKLSPGIYVQQGQYSNKEKNMVQVGLTAYRINGDGTFDYTDYYDGASTIWSGHGIYKASRSSVTLVWKGNPMVAEGYTVNMTIYDKNTIGNSFTKYKRIE